MKLTPWLLPALASLTAVSVLAQASNSLPPVIASPPPTASAAEPAAKPKPKHKKAKAKHTTEAKEAKPAATNTSSHIVLNPPVTATVKCNVLDVRGQGSFNGEIITYAKKGESLTVLEEITLGHVRANEPAQWSQIVMPANTAVWVSAAYIDADGMTVRAKKVNVRGGPGENYSIVARLEKGAVVKQIGKKEGWLEIASPTNAIAYVASEYLEVGPATPAPELAAAPAPAPAPPPAPVVVNVPVEPAPPAPARPAEATSTGLTAPAPTATSQSDQELAALRRATAPQPAATTPSPTAAQPESARIVTREGFVHRAHNIQAPAGFELHDIKTGVLTEYLQPAPGQKSFKAFIGARMRLTGSEFLDPDWPRTPVLHVETVDLMP